MQIRCISNCLKKFALLIVFLSVIVPAFSQIDSLLIGSKDSLLVPRIVNDSTLKGEELESNQDDIELDAALKVLKSYYMESSNWEDSDDGLKEALQKLINYVEDGPIDTTLNYLKGYNFRVMSKQERVSYDSSLKAFEQQDTIRIVEIQSKTQAVVNDSVLQVSRDSLGVVGAANVEDLQNDRVIIDDTTSQKPIQEYDSLFIEDGLIVDDSFKKALDALVSYIENDSVKVWVHNIAGDSTNITLKRDGSLPQRFWLKNEVLDSLGIWLEVMDGSKIQLFTDRGIDFNTLNYRKNKRKYNLKRSSVDRNLKDVKLIEIEPNPWDIGGIGQLLLSQVYLSNWAQGGENTISGLFRVEVDANYTKGMYRWNNYLRLKFGMVGIASEGVRKNEDNWEVNSDFGIKASKKWFYSLSFNLRSQLAKGYKYPNDSVWVSSFFSPGYLYSAAGFEYKPKKTTSVLLSPLTYKSVFVIDTNRVEHIIYGIPLGSKAKNELGLYMKIQYKYNFTDDIELENRLHLFTNYNGFDKIDFNWEAILRIKIGPFFTFNFSTHLIFDSDIKFPILDDSGNVVDTKAKLQFKEWLGFGVAYKF